MCVSVFESLHEKICLMPYVNKKGADQPAHQTARMRDCADAQADLCLCCSHMAKAGFLMTWLNFIASLLDQ